MEDANTGYKSLGFDCRIHRILSHLPPAERQKILRYRNHEDSLRGACCAALIRLLWGALASATRERQHTHASRATKDSNTTTTTVCVESGECDLCAGYAEKDSQGRPTWRGTCPHTLFPTTDTSPAAANISISPTTCDPALSLPSARHVSLHNKDINSSSGPRSGCACVADVNGSHHGNWVAAGVVPRGRVGK